MEFAICESEMFGALRELKKDNFKSNILPDSVTDDQTYQRVEDPQF